MTLILMFYGFIAGGSVDGEVFLYLGIFVVVIILIAGIVAYIDGENKKKRLGLKEKFESEEKEFDLSDKVGDDRISIYFDNVKEKVLMLSISTDNIDKYYVDEFKKTNVEHASYSYCAIDYNRRKVLMVQLSDDKFNYKVETYNVTDTNVNTVINNNIPPRLDTKFLSEKATDNIIVQNIPTYILLEEQFGHIAIFKNQTIKSFYYIKQDFISKKTGDKPYATLKRIGSYVFVLDEYFKVLVIISPLISTHKILNYSDIMNVTYEEDGNTLFTKSMTRTVGGALVGGALLGGAGAIVGGLSGDTSQNKKVQSMNIKILVRNTTTPSVNLPINLKDETFNTKEEKSRKTYKKRIQEANEIKDLISVIIDNSNQQPTVIPTIQKVEASQPATGIADELKKLALLKEAGVLSEEEFQAQKNKLLN